jgi:putative NADPH-quinone reductase
MSCGFNLDDPRDGKAPSMRDQNIGAPMPYDSRAVAGYVARLMVAEKLVFVFPQWWFKRTGDPEGLL